MTNPHEHCLIIRFYKLRRWVIWKFSRSHQREMSSTVPRKKIDYEWHKAENGLMFDSKVHCAIVRKILFQCEFSSEVKTFDFKFFFDSYAREPFTKLPFKTFKNCKFKTKKCAIARAVMLKVKPRCLLLSEHIISRFQVRFTHAKSEI